MRFYELVDLVESLSDDEGKVNEEILVRKITAADPSAFLRSACDLHILRRIIGLSNTYYMLDYKAYDLKDERQRIRDQDQSAKTLQLVAVATLIVSVLTLVATAIGIFV